LIERIQPFTDLYKPTSAHKAIQFVLKTVYWCADYYSWFHLSTTIWKTVTNIMYLRIYRYRYLCLKKLVILFYF